MMFVKNMYAASFLNPWFCVIDSPSSLSNDIIDRQSTHRPPWFRTTKIQAETHGGESCGLGGRTSCLQIRWGDGKNADNCTRYVNISSVDRTRVLTTGPFVQ